MRVPLPSGSVSPRVAATGFLGPGRACRSAAATASCAEVRPQPADGEVGPEVAQGRARAQGEAGDWRAVAGAAPGRVGVSAQSPRGRTQPTKPDGDLRCPGWGPGRGEPTESPSAVPRPPRSPGPSRLSTAPLPPTPDYGCPCSAEGGWAGWEASVVSP